MAKDKIKFIVAGWVCYYLLAVVAIGIRCVEPDKPIKRLHAPDSLWMEGAALCWSVVDYDSLWFYKVYKGRESGAYGYPYTVYETSLIFDDLVEGVTYFTVVSAVDSVGRESERSKEISFLWRQSGKQAIRIWWAPNIEEDLQGYCVYRGVASRQYEFKIDVGNVAEFVDSCYQGVYYWAVTAYDTADNESEFSSEVSLKVEGGNDLGVDKRKFEQDISNKPGSGRRY